MKKLIKGIVDFRQNLTPVSRQLFAELALGQKPDALFFACSDSRVVPNLFASTNPGDLFVVRNIGNLIPPYILESQESCVLAAVEFALYALNIPDVVVCGHSECGAMQAICKGIDTLAQPHLVSWLRYGEEALELVKKGVNLDPSLAFHNQVSQINVLQQIQHLNTYPFVRERLEKGQLRLHAWWFDIAQADVYCFEPKLNQFVLIDEAEAKLIMERLSNFQA